MRGSRNIISGRTGVERKHRENNSSNAEGNVGGPRYHLFRPSAIGRALSVFPGFFLFLRGRTRPLEQRDDIAGIKSMRLQMSRTRIFTDRSSDKLGTGFVWSFDWFLICRSFFSKKKKNTVLPLLRRSWSKGNGTINIKQFIRKLYDAISSYLKWNWMYRLSSDNKIR